jgi:hypothetical protein
VVLFGRLKMMLVCVCVCLFVGLDVLRVQTHGHPPAAFFLKSRARSFGVS